MVHVLHVPKIQTVECFKAVNKTNEITVRKTEFEKLSLQHSNNSWVFGCVCVLNFLFIFFSVYWTRVCGSLAFYLLTYIIRSRVHVFVHTFLFVCEICTLFVQMYVCMCS